MPWTNPGPNGELAAPNPNAAFFRSLGLNDDGTGPAGAPAAGPAAPSPAPALPQGVPTATVTMGGANRPRPAVAAPGPVAQGPQPAALAPQQPGSYVPATPPPADPAGTVFPQRDVQAFQQYLGGNGGYLPPSMAVAAAPGQAAPEGARALTTDTGANYFVDAAANPLSARGGPGQIATAIPGVNMPTFEQFKWQNLNSGIGANTPALMQAYMRLQSGVAGVENQRGQTANSGLEATARFGPNGLGQQEMTLRQGELALNAANAQLRQTSWARRADTETRLIQAGMPPDAAARRVAEMERQGSFNGPTIDMTQIPGLPGFVPRSPTGPASPLPAAGGPAPGGAAPTGRPGVPPPPAPVGNPPRPGAPPVGNAGNSPLIINPQNPLVTPPPGPVYEDLARQVEAQFPRPEAGKADTTPGALVMRLAQAFPTMFSGTPEGLRNRAAIFPYLNSRFNPQDVSHAAQGTWSTPFGDLQRSGLDSAMGALPMVGRVFSSLFDRGQNSTPDLEGRAVLRSMQAGRW